MTHNYEVRYWMQVLGVSRADLEAAVQLVGSNVEAVRKHLETLPRIDARAPAHGDTRTDALGYPLSTALPAVGLDD